MTEENQAEHDKRQQVAHNVSIGRVNAMRGAKKDGLVGSEPEIQEEEPVILERPPRRRPNQTEAPWAERSLGGGPGQ